MIIKIVAAALGFIAGVLSYPELDKYMLAIFAVIVAICVGIIVYILVAKFLVSLLNSNV